MSAIFLSHSSKDLHRAALLKDFLEQIGHNVFLDNDPDSGIAGGANWERTLYDRLHVCRVVIPLLSPDWLSSKWCFAELVYARATGKTILPVKISNYPEPRVFAEIQEIDLTEDIEEGRQRLERALREVFPWKPDRPPYPGLSAYTEEDAPIFFGRDAEIPAGLEQLESLRRRGRAPPRLLMVLGASGSGKSSLVRAGLMPRLRRSEREWIVIPAFRPRAAPIHELAVAVAAAYKKSGYQRDWSEIANTCMPDPALGDKINTSLLDIARDLRVRFGVPEATVLLVIDQAEELFGASDSAQTTAFLRVLRSALDCADAELMVLATIRSDFLDVFQRHRFLQERNGFGPLAYDRLMVDPLPASRIPEVIRRPATLVGLHVEDALVEQLISDIRAGAPKQDAALGDDHPPTHTVEALPLLAFTLRRLWDIEEYRKDGQLDLDEYSDLGGLAGAVARVADDALKDVAVTPDVLRALRAGFIPGLVRVTPDGVRTRRRALLASMPPEAMPLLQKLVEAHLLVTDRDATGQNTIEVAHEALFQMWPQLARWLDEDQDKLRLIESLRQAASDWQATGSREDLLVHSGGRLSEALALFQDEHDRRFANGLDPLATSYLLACKDLRDRRDLAARQEEERRIQDAKTIRWRTRIGLVGVVALLAALVTLQVIRSRAATAQSLAQDESRLALANQWNGKDPSRAGLVLQELTHPLTIFKVRTVALSVLSQPLALAELPHENAVIWADISPDGYLVVTVSQDGHARIWRPDSGLRPQLLDQSGVLRASFSPDGHKIVTTAMDRTASLWSADGHPTMPRLTHDSVISDVGFSPAGDRLVAGSFAGGVRVWDADREGSPLILRAAQDDIEVIAVSFDSSGRHVLAAFGDGKVRIWDMTGTQPAGPLMCDYHERLVGAGFAANDKTAVVTITRNGALYRWLPYEAPPDTACASSPLIPGGKAHVVGVAINPTTTESAMLQEDGSIRMLRKPITDDPLILASPGVSARQGVFTASGHALLVGYADGSARLWRLDESAEPLVFAGHDGPIGRVAASHDSLRMVTASDDGTARVWSYGEVPAGERVFIPLLHERNVTAVDVSRNGVVLTASLNAEVHLWRLDGAWIRKFVHRKAVRQAAFSPKGDQLLSVANDGGVRMWRPDQPDSKEQLLEDVLEPYKAIFAAFSPDGARVVATSADGNARIWNVERPAEPIRLRGHQPGKPITFAAFNPTGDQVVTASEDGTARIWQADREAKEVMVLTHPSEVAVRSAMFSPDGKWIVTASSDPVARVWQIGRQEPVARFPHGSPLRVAIFSPDSRSVLTAGEDGIARIWQINGTTAPIQLIGHSPGEALVSAQFSSDGKLVLTASEDRTARLWSADGADDPVVFRSHTKSLVGAVFTPTGDRIVTGSSDGRAIIWTIAPDSLIAIIRARSRLCLRPEFRVHYFLEDWTTAEARSSTCEVAQQRKGSPQ